MEVLAKYMLQLSLDLLKLWIYVCGSPCQIHLTTFIKSCKTVDICLWKSLSNTSYHFYYILLNCEYTFVEVLVKYILLLLLYLVKLWVYVCGSPCQIHLTSFIISCQTMNIQLWEVLVKYIWLLLLYLVKLWIYVYGSRCQIYLITFIISC